MQVFGIFFHVNGCTFKQKATTDHHQTDLQKRMTANVNFAIILHSSANNEIIS